MSETRKLREIFTSSVATGPEEEQIPGVQVFGKRAASSPGYPGGWDGAQMGQGPEPLQVRITSQVEAKKDSGFGGQTTGRCGATPWESLEVRH